MSAILKVNPRVTRLINYIKEIEEGKLQIPLFQRDFVWGKKEKLELFESLKLGYPIGSLLFWKPKESFKVREEIGPYKIPKNENVDNDFFYILDGFQRLSTLFGCLINPQKTSLKINELDLLKEFSIFYDLENEEFTLSRAIPIDITLIPVNTLIDTYAFLDYVEKLRNEINDLKKSTELIDKARLLSSAILDYQLPSIEIIGGSIEDAVDIFSRINSMGSKISTDWMVSALTYSEENEGFRLGSLIDDLLDDLKQYNFSGIKRELILQCIQSSFGKIYFDEKIKDLVKKKNFENQTRTTLKSIKKAVSFLFENLLVIDGKLLPYGNQLVFITYFFNQIETPTEKEKENLRKWFWVTTYSSYFTIYSLSKQREAFEHFKRFVAGEIVEPVYNDKPNISFSVPDFPKNINFGSVRAKALILFLLNYGNNFRQVNASEVEQLKIYYLFKDNREPAAVIPLIEFVNKPLFEYHIKKPNDLSFMLHEFFNDEADRNYFITENMRKLYKEEKIDEILYLRLSDITLAEMKFVKKYDLEYSELF